MGDAADDMFDIDLKNSLMVYCKKHKNYYDPQYGCELCEDGLPPVREKSKIKVKIKGGKNTYLSF